MALSINEGTKQEVLDLFTMPGGFKAGYVKINHMELDYVNNQANLIIGKYASEEARNADEDNCIMEGIGFPVTPEAMKAIKVTDNRDVFYPYIIAQVQYLALEEEKKLADFDEQAYNIKVQAIYDELSLENPYKQEQVNEDETETIVDA